jgi:type I restriction-modification system DNA methylase subunit
MWNLAKQLGLKHGNILEPSMGVGGFFATMPKEIFENSTLTGIEIEPTSGEIAKNLYPSAHVFVQGYEDFIKPNNSYDFIISNVPYASISMENTEEAKQFSNPKSVMIHDFFFLRGVNQLRPGGIMMALTSTGTMDKQDAQVRIALAQKAELVGAIRLPNKTFKQSGGTDVSCDLLVFRKRETPISYIEASKEPWINTKVVDESSAGKVVKINDYFAKNEQNIIGAAEVGSGRFGPTLNVNFAGSAEEFEQRLNDCIKENFPKNIMGKTLTKEESEFKSADISHPNRTFYMKNGDLMFRRNDEEVSLAKSGTIKSAKKMPK